MGSFFDSTRYGMTIEEACSIQHQQVLWYAHLHPQGEAGLREAILAKTDISDLVPGVTYDIHTINESVPRGSDIEHILGVDFGGD